MLIIFSTNKSLQRNRNRLQRWRVFWWPLLIEQTDERQACEDNAPVMRNAWEEIERRYPHISANGCAAHGMNLLIKDLLDDPSCEKTIQESAKIIKFVNNHHLIQAKFELLRKEAKVQHKLSLPVVTRWYSHFNSMQTLHSAKYVLSRLCDEEAALIGQINPKAISVSVLRLIKSPDFWQRLSYCIKLIDYPTQIIGKNILKT